MQEKNGHKNVLMFYTEALEINWKLVRLPYAAETLLNFYSLLRQRSEDKETTGRRMVKYRNTAPWMSLLLGIGLWSWYGHGQLERESQGASSCRDFGWKLLEAQLTLAQGGMEYISSMESVRYWKSIRKGFCMAGAGAPCPQEPVSHHMSSDFHCFCFIFRQISTQVVTAVAIEVRDIYSSSSAYAQWKGSFPKNPSRSLGDALIVHGWPGKQSWQFCLLWPSQGQCPHLELEAKGWSPYPEEWVLLSKEGERDPGKVKITFVHQSPPVHKSYHLYTYSRGADWPWGTIPRALGYTLVLWCFFPTVSQGCFLL